jgi:hypothetical protein
MTKTKWMIGIGAGLLTAVLLLTLVVPAFAQSATATPQTPLGLRGWGRGGMRFGGGSWDTFDVAAKALGMTPEQLFAELHAGKTLEDVAKDKGVDFQKVTDALKAARVDAAKTQIEQAVKDGKLTREQADWLLKGLDLGMPMGRFGGRGFGRDGCGRSSSGTQTPSTTPVAPTSYSF